MSDDLSIIQSPDGVVADVRTMIEQTRKGVSRAVNAGMTLLYWRVGSRIQSEVLQNERAEYGKEIVASLGRQLAEGSAAAACSIWCGLARFFRTSRLCNH